MFFQQLINGLTTGSVYALIALGYTMIYGMLGLINFAQGEIYMCGAFVTVLLLATGAGQFLPGLCPGHGRRRPFGRRVGAGGLPAPAGLPSPGAADQRHRRLHLPAEPGPAAVRPQ